MVSAGRVHMGCWGAKGQLCEACCAHQIPIEGTSNQYGMLTRWAEQYKPICCFGSDLRLQQSKKNKKNPFQQPVPRVFYILFIYWHWSTLRFVWSLLTSTDYVITSPVDSLADKKY